MSEKPLGALIDALEKTRRQQRDLNEKLKKVKDGYNELEQAIIARMTESGIDKAAGKTASVTVKRAVLGSIGNYDTLCKYIKRTGQFHLLNRALNSASFRELYERELDKGSSAEKLYERTGLSAYIKTTLNHSSMK
jgi:hypothetical protein